MTEVRNFNVLARVSEPDEPDQYGNISYWLRLEGVEKNALIRHKKDKPLKNAGEVIEGYYLEEKKSQADKDYLKLTRPQQQQQNNNGGKSGAERESIERQVAAKCASDLLVGFMNTGWKPDTALKLADLHTVLAKQIAEEIKTP